MTHAELVEIARNWLKNPKNGSRRGDAVTERAGCCVVVSEIASQDNESPDAFGWHGLSTTLIECKTSRSDFLRDAKKFPRQHLSMGIGDYRWYLTAEGSGAIKESDVLPKGLVG